MNNFQTSIQPHRTAITVLAVFGFIALVAAGMWLAVYSTRFVPSVVNGAGEAAVYIGSIFTRENEPTLSVVTSPTTIFFGVATTTDSVKPQQVSSINQVKTTAGVKTSNTYQISGTTTTKSLSGLPDLVVNITEVGYLTSTSTDSFVASSTIHAGIRPAVKFTIKNIGTNVTGSWRFRASIPTQSSYIYYSKPNETISLNPGEYIDYVLGFDQAISGADKIISITVNFDHAVTESNFNNNSTSTKVTIIGG